MLFNESHDHETQVGSDPNKFPLQSRWMLVTLALMGFAEKYHYYYQIGSKKSEELTSDANNENTSSNQDIYSPNSGDFINSRLKRHQGNDEIIPRVTGVHFQSKYSDYTYDLSKQIDAVLRPNKVVKQVDNTTETKKENNDEMRDNSMDKKNQEDSKLKEMFAESLADNVAGQNDTSPNHTIVKNTILNQIDTNKVLSEEYKHFLQMHADKEKTVAASKNAEATKKQASQSAIIYEAQGSSAVSTLDSITNNRTQSTVSSTSENELDQSLQSSSNDLTSSAAVESSSSVTLGSSSASEELETSSEAESQSSNPAATYFDSANNGYNQVSSVNDFVNSVSDYVNGSRSNFDNSVKSLHHNIDRINRNIDQIDDDGERISPYFSSLSDELQATINQINQDVQSVATENDSIADQTDLDSAQLASDVNQINNNVSSVKNAFTDAKRFFSAADLSYKNRDGNATNIYASYVNSAASVAIAQNDSINETLNTFNSILVQESSYADQTTANDSLIASNAAQNSQILESVESQIQASSVAAASASASAAQSASASVEAERQASIMASQSAQSASEQAAIQARMQAQQEQAARRSQQDAFLQQQNFGTQQQFMQSSENTAPSSFASLFQNQVQQPTTQSSFASQLDFGNQFDSQVQNQDQTEDYQQTQTDNYSNNDNSVIDNNVQKEMDTISNNYNHAAQMVNKMDVVTKQLVSDNQHLQDLFTLLKGEFNQTKERAAKGQTTNMIAMTISKMDALMTNASQIISRVKQVNQNSSNDYQTSVQSLNKIKQYQDQLTSIIQIAQTFDPLTAMSVGSMAESTLNRTNDYYNQIKKVNDDLMDASQSIQAEINTMNSYYQVASKNSQLMDSINQMSSVAQYVEERSDQVDSLYNEVHANFSSLDAYKSQASSLMNKMDQVKDYVNQKHFAINEYASMMPKNTVLEELSQQVSLAAEEVDSAQNDVQRSANDIAQTYSMANTPMSNLSNVRAQVHLAGMNTSYYASQAIINFNTGDTVNVDNSIKQMNTYQQALTSMYSAASDAADDVHVVLQQVNPGDSFQSLAEVAKSASAKADAQMNRAVDIYNGLSIGINRANEIATKVSHLFDESGEKIGSSDRVMNNVNTNIQHANSILNAIGTSNDITDLYAKQILAQISDPNNLNARQAEDLAQKSKQSVMNSSPIKISLQQISSQVSQRRDAMNANYSLISNQADTANQYIQHAFEQLSQGNLDIANDYLDQAESSVNSAKQTLDRYQSDLDWVQSMIGNTNQLIQQAEQINSVVSNTADTTQRIASQLGATK